MLPQMTVGSMIALLQQFDPNTKVIVEVGASDVFCDVEKVNAQEMYLLRRNGQGDLYFLTPHPLQVNPNEHLRQVSVVIIR